MAITLDIETLRHARLRLAGRVHCTPVVTSRQLSAIAGCEVVLKGEHLQRSGSFKIRGATHFLLALSEADLARGVVTASSGNHGQAVALAASEIGAAATIVVPEDVAPVKAAAIRGYGAALETAGLTSEDRAERAGEIAAAGAIYVPPYDHARIIEGQSTLGQELVEQCEGLDAVAVPVGGGGLISGTALALKTFAPHVRVIGVETERADDANQSFRAGRRVAIDLPDTIADGMRNLQVGELNWEIIRTHVDDMVTVSEDEVREAMVLLMTRAKVVAEPTGAVAPAAVIAGRVRGDRVAAVVSGGNLDPSVLASILPA